MSVALVLVCVDPRLNHELLRIQVGQHLARLELRAERVYMVNDIGGNVGANFDHTIDLLQHHGQPPVLVGILHHDDCLADQAGLRAPLALTALDVGNRLEARALRCPVHTGNIHTATNQILWDHDAEPRYAPYQAFAS